MWTRKEIKDYAKGFLEEHYWKAFLVCLIVTLLTGSGNNSRSSRGNINNDINQHYYNSHMMNERHGGEFSIRDNSVSRFGRNFMARSPISYLFASSIALGLALLFILLLTVGYALQVGQARFFLRGFRGDAQVGNLFSVFNREEYFGIVKVQFVRGLYLVLWTLLLFIPGIVKSYEYRMVPYILSENPNLSPSEAIAMSRDMTNGHKMDMFILDLSFIGWNILGALVFGLVSFFVRPYIEATEARLYEVLSGNDGMDDPTIEII